MSCIRSMTVVLTVVLCVIQTSSALDEYSRQAVENTATEYKAFHESLTQTEETLQDIDKALDEVKKKMALLPSDPKLKEVAKQLDAVRNALEKETATFGKVTKYSGKVSNGFEAMLKVDSILNDAKSRRGGPLAQNLDLLAEAMKGFGDKLPIPLVGKIISAYGEVTDGILNATDTLAKKLQDERTQGALGVYRSSDERWQAFVKQFPEKAKQVNLMPQEVPFVPFIYQDDYNASDPKRYIWDGKEWYVADNDKVNVNQAMLDVIIAGKRPEAKTMILMQEKADLFSRRRQAGIDLFRFLADFKKGVKFDPATYRKIFETNFSGSEQLGRALSDPELFRALATCDPHFTGDLSRRIAKTREALLELKDSSLKRDIAVKLRELDRIAANIHPQAASSGDAPARTEPDGPAELPIFAKSTADRTAVSGAAVVAQNLKTGKRYRGRTGSDGKTSLKGLPVGYYRIAGMAEKFQPYVQHKWNVFESNNQEMTLYLKPALPSLPVTVTVTDKDTGKPIGGAQVSITGADRYWHNTGGNGKTVFQLAGGSWTVAADAYGYAGMVTSAWVDPDAQKNVAVAIALPPRPDELKKPKQETEHEAPVFDAQEFFAGDDGPEKSPEKPNVDLPDEPALPEGVTDRKKINDWRDSQIARLRKEGNARLDKIRAELKKAEGTNIHHGCPGCSAPGPHFWDGHGWSCSCGYTVMSVGEYPTGAGSYNAVKAHYQRLIGSINTQADRRLNR